MTVFLPLRKP